jgi:putative heme-binding domain-containing protein
VRGALEAALASQEPLAVQRAALSVLGGSNHPAVADILLSHWATFGPQLREQAVETLFSRKPWLEKLLDALEAGGFIVRDLDSNRRQALLKHDDPVLRARAEKLFAASMLSPRDEVVKAHQDVLNLPGDAARGHEIYLKNCAQCHRIKEEGFAVGPDLVTVAQSGAEKILTNILDPNREVNQQYVNYTVDTKDLETISGVVASDTASSVTLKRAFGENTTILRSNIEDMRSEKLSIMPEGLEQGLSKQDLADVIAFITKP